MQTSHGIWRVREGILIELENKEAKIYQGEIAPIPWFGSENLGDALKFCTQLGNTVSENQINHIPDTLPACQFAFESALERFNQQDENDIEKPLKYSYLLPAGNQVLDFDLNQIINNSSTNSINTFKWKIGVYPVEQEITTLHQLILKLPPHTKLRLDANGGLTLKQAHQWLEVTDEINSIEFFEQPLPPSEFSSIKELQTKYNTPLALDESVANLKQLQECYYQGWRGIFVIKAAIVGKPSLLRQFCRKYTLDIVFSSVFETPVGRQVVLRLAQQLGNSQRAVGFGVITNGQ